MEFIAGAIILNSARNFEYEQMMCLYFDFDVQCHTKMSSASFNSFRFISFRRLVNSIRRKKITQNIIIIRETSSSIAAALRVKS
jgi:hypothetical protein